MKLAKKTIKKIKSRGVRLKGGYTLVKLTPLGRKRFRSKLKTKKRK